MKLLLNGYTVSENLRLARIDNDIKFASIVLDHIKKNKGMYLRLVLITAFMLHYNINYVFADNIESSVTSTFSQLIELLKDFAKWGCLGMGLKRLIEETLSGASFKQASVAGLQFWLIYIMIMLYPMLYDMIKL